MENRLNIQRKSNIELLRVIAILFVVTVHVTFGATGIPESEENYTIPTLLVESLTLIGVNLFVLISGYFSISLKKYSIANILFICLFYGVLKLVVEIINNEFSLKYLLFVSSSNWFIVAYLGLMLASPLLNQYADTCSKRNLLITILSFIIFQFWFGNIELWANKSFAYGYSVMSLSILYLIGRFLKHYGIPVWMSRFGLLLYLLSSLFTSCLAVFLLRQDLPQSTIKELLLRVYSYNSIIVITASIAFFSVFANWQIPYVKFVNRIAKSSLAVLLIHTIPSIQLFLQNFFYVNVWQGINVPKVFLGGRNLWCICTFGDN